MKTTTQQLFSAALLAMATQAQYTYGGACATLTDDDCANTSGCTSCNWSWPTDDSQQWNSSEAMCRCESGGNNDSDSNSSGEYVYGGACATNQD